MDQVAVSIFTAGLNTHQAGLNAPVPMMLLGTRSRAHPITHQLRQAPAPRNTTYQMPNLLIGTRYPQVLNAVDGPTNSTSTRFPQSRQAPRNTTYQMPDLLIGTRYLQ